tara:strand:- start:812 stop:1036 length:225 start_codon:yes stop_codon:yes gene_type:complete
MPKKQTLKFSIRQDGLVSEEVFGAIGTECQNLTRTIEEKLGEVTYIEPKPEYYQQENVTLQHNQDQNQEQTTTT